DQRERAGRASTAAAAKNPLTGGARRGNKCASMSGFLEDLASIRPDQERVFGGKAVGLGRLAAAGARVPPGFAVSAQTRPPEQWQPRWREALRERATPLLSAGPVAVRSSAPGEDSAALSFAGLFETVLAAPEGGRVARAGLGGGEAERERGPGREVLTAAEAIEIAQGAAAQATSLGRPLDLEWARDERELWWLQARPITAAVAPRAYD